MRIPRLASKKYVRIGLILLGLAVLAESGLRVAGYFYLQGFYKRQYEAMPAGVEPINIICLGESSTAGLWVDWKDSYPKQLEKMLREFYGTQRIRVIVPVHVGQNSSQVSNRISDYIRLYQPKVVVVMTGYNNEWSLAESHIGQFVPVSTASAWRVRGLIALDGVRLFKVLRYGYHAAFSDEGSLDRDRLGVLGHPELVQYPPADWVYSFARSNKEAFVELWKYDVKHVIQETREHNVKAVLMTYHINPTYLSSGEFVSMAAEEKIPLVRNDKSFDDVIRRGAASRYLLYDHWHPNRFGYTIIANNAFREISHGDLLSLGKGVHQEQTQIPSGLEQAEELPAYPEKGGIDFGGSGVQAFLGDGWSGPEGAFRWTDNIKSEILFALDNVHAEILDLKLHPFLAPGRLGAQRLIIKMNGRPVADLVLSDPDSKVYSIRLPKDVLDAKNVLQLEVPDARSPQELGISKDSRRLGIAMELVRLR